MEGKKTDTLVVHGEGKYIDENVLDGTRVTFHWLVEGDCAKRYNAGLSLFKETVRHGKAGYHKE